MTYKKAGECIQELLNQDDFDEASCLAVLAIINSTLNKNKSRVGGSAIRGFGRIT